MSVFVPRPGRERNVMSELIALIFTPQVRMVLMFLAVCLVLLYLLSIVYVIKDARARGSQAWWAWGIVSIVPLVGLVAYLILRPPSYAIDRDEQELEIALREHELLHYGTCPNCNAPIDRDFIVCPMCDTQVRNVCPNCHRPLNADWHVCPYCRTHIA